LFSVALGLVMFAALWIGGLAYLTAVFALRMTG
jgi:hypothetical protein